ncbi:MAG: glycyl-radical enzyme activating protein [Candidatus Lokiarchaeota archaeon]|nr:glycyl-radical enzyme activating protein [Candidatus Lokiarchaeota archaeon]
MLDLGKKGFITDIKRNSLDDGPGIRTVIFFKGCPLSCIWCQNPECMQLNQEISYSSEDCINCNECSEICPEDAINFSLNYPIIIEKCTYCGKCIMHCKTKALKFVGSFYTVKELLDTILIDKPFFENSNGGITLSGGEATYQMPFLHLFLKQAKSNNIHVCLETCGFFNKEPFFERILPFIDLVYFDLKIFDEKLHMKYCGVSNKKIFENFTALLDSKSVKVLPRIPLIPKITLNDNNLNQWANYLEDLGIKKIELLPYNPLWHSKVNSIGKSLQFTHSEWLDAHDKVRINKFFSAFEFRDI